VVTFQDILNAFNEYKKHECKQTWDALWLASNQRMTELVCIELSKRHVCKDERSGIIDDAVSKIMERFKGANFADIPWIESRFMLEKKSVLTIQTWSVKKASRLVDMEEYSNILSVNILQIPCKKDDFF
jgi:hypothetical protein